MSTYFRASLGGLMGAMLLLATPANARGPIEPEAGQPWAHGNSGLTFPATLGGLPRIRMNDFSNGQWDVVALYETPDRSTIISLYAYRTSMWSAPANFATAERSIMMNAQSQPGFLGDLKTFSGPTAFSPRGSGVASGMRITYAAGSGTYKATALAVIPHTTRWTFKIRMTSRDMDAAALDAKLSSIISEVKWPDDTYTQAQAAPVVPCQQPLLTAKLPKPVKDAGIESLAGRSMIASLTPQTTSKPPIYCLEDSNIFMGVFRITGSNDAYFIALADNGTTLNVGPSIGTIAGMKSAAKTKSGKIYDVIMEAPDSLTLFTPQDGLPSVKDTLNLMRGQRIGTIRHPMPGQKGPTIEMVAPK